MQEFDLPLGVVAPYHQDDPILKNIYPRTLEAASVGNTLAMLINAGQIVDEITKLTVAASIPLPWKLRTVHFQSHSLYFTTSHLR